MPDTAHQDDADWFKQIDDENCLQIIGSEGEFICELGPLDDAYLSDDPEEAKLARENMQRDADLIAGSKRLLRVAKALLERDAKTTGGITKGWGGELELVALQEAVDICDGKQPAPTPAAIHQPEGTA